jgi:hypothetical protein
MGRPYGKIKRKSKRSSVSSKVDSEPFKIKLRGKDNAPLTMREIQQGLLEAIRELRKHESVRAKWLTIYATLIDQDGKEIVLDASGQWELYPYKSAADEFEP